MTHTPLSGHPTAPTPTDTLGGRTLLCVRFEFATRRRFHRHAPQPSSKPDDPSCRRHRRRLLRRPRSTVSPTGSLRVGDRLQEAPLGAPCLRVATVSAERTSSARLAKCWLRVRTRSRHSTRGHRHAFVNRPRARSSFVKQDGLRIGGVTGSHRRAGSRAGRCAPTGCVRGRRLGLGRWGRPPSRLRCTRR